ncbi:MAG: phosphatase PAP2 family protein [Prevotella sp.]|jgi:membrane-associated phospholipid phosphatase
MNLFTIDKNPRKGLLWVEWVVLAYLAFTLIIMLFSYVKLANPSSMIWGRVRVVTLMAAMWAVYRLLPCRATMLLRVCSQMALLAWWYPDTYEINRIFTNLDYLVAEWDQSLFGCQPALLFSTTFTSPIISELLHLGYVSYYPMIALTVLVYFFRRYDEFERCAFIIMGSFFIYYAIFDLMPVAGPTFYYKAVGLDEIAKGVFPHLGDYFNYHQESFQLPGYSKGIFYQLVADAQATGERPTAAFPSSHVGVSTICMFLLYRLRQKKLLLGLLPIYILLCFATVYIQAHYLVDVLAGWVSAIAIYFLLLAVSANFRNFAPQHSYKRKK